MIRQSPEHRYAERVLWESPILLQAELSDYAELDRRIEGGAGCAACGRGLDYPLVEVLAGMRALHLHADCARRLAEGIMADVEEIENEEEL